MASDSGATPSIHRAHPKQSRKISSSSRRLICANCRRRKVCIAVSHGVYDASRTNNKKTKCDGTHPSCKTCEVYQDQCHYDKSPPMSQILAMSEKIQELERTIEDLKQRQHSTGENTNLSGSHWSQSMNAPTWTPKANVESILDGKIGVSNRNSPSNAKATDTIGMLAELSLDENGQEWSHVDDES